MIFIHNILYRGIASARVVDGPAATVLILECVPKNHVGDNLNDVIHIQGDPDILRKMLAEGIVALNEMEKKSEG